MSLFPVWDLDAINIIYFKILLNHRTFLIKFIQTEWNVYRMKIYTYLFTTEYFLSLYIVMWIPKTTDFYFIILNTEQEYKPQKLIFRSQKAKKELRI